MWWLSVPVLLLLTGVYLYNNLHARRNQIEFAKGSIDTLLKKRHDLVPSLNRIVSGYAQHEKSLFEHLAKSREEAMRYASLSPARFKGESSIASGLEQLFILAENYPELKADQQFLQLQKTLLELEEQISAARRFYNAAINDYNNAVQTFPGNMMAGMLNFKRQGYFTIPPIESQVPPVRL
jgi:LemA protein